MQAIRIAEIRANVLARQAFFQKITTFLVEKLPVVEEVLINVFLSVRMLLVCIIKTLKVISNYAKRDCNLR